VLTSTRFNKSIDFIVFATNDAEPKSIYMDIITSLRMELA